MISVLIEGCGEFTDYPEAENFSVVYGGVLILLGIRAPDGKSYVTQRAFAVGRWSEVRKTVEVQDS
jgi:hypothetical protein